jgi:predicted transcriptional regulator YdeE
LKELAQNGARGETASDSPGGARRTLCALKELAQNGARRETASDSPGGARRTLRALKELAQNGARRETASDFPGGARRTLCALQEPIRMEQQTSTLLASPRLIKAEALLIFGLAQHCPRVGDPGIPSQWSRFLPHLGHIDGQIGNVAYGVIYNSDDSGNYDYLCGVAVREFPANPQEFTQLRIPAQSYAVFQHRDHISAIANTWKAIWEHGLADAGYKALDAPAFERYDEKFDGRTGLGGLEIWIPVRS